jgi:hypothetical protein
VAAGCVLAATLASAHKAAAADSIAAENQSLPPVHAAGHAPDQSWPKLLPGALAQSKPVAPLQWSAQDIAFAQAHCKAVLRGLDVVAVPEMPIREGVACGTPAPMKLISVGRNPPVSFSPPPILTCDMIASLGRWLGRDVQPLARRHLGAPVIQVETMSSYSCRNAYGRPGRKLSEHGHANALDVRGFVTARGKAALVVADWGPTVRETKASTAIAKARVVGGSWATVTTAARPQAGAGIEQAALAPVTVDTPSIRGGMTLSIPGLGLSIPGVPSGPTALGLAEPHRLGGPKPAKGPGTPPSARAVVSQANAQFLRAAHRSACGIFGTVLGPEANKAHRNHFHVDMAERAAVPVICE